MNVAACVACACLLQVSIPSTPEKEKAAREHVAALANQRTPTGPRLKAIAELRKIGLERVVVKALCGAVATDPAAEVRQAAYVGLLAVDPERTAVYIAIIRGWDGVAIDALGSSLTIPPGAVVPGTKRPWPKSRKDQDKELESQLDETMTPLLIWQNDVKPYMLRAAVKYSPDDPAIADWFCRILALRSAVGTTSAEPDMLAVLSEIHHLHEPHHRRAIQAITSFLTACEDAPGRAAACSALGRFGKSAKGSVSLLQRYEKRDADESVRAAAGAAVVAIRAAK